MLKKEIIPTLIAVIAHLLILFLVFFNTSGNQKAPILSFNVKVSNLSITSSQTKETAITKKVEKIKPKKTDDGLLKKDEQKDSESTNSNVAVSNDSDIIFNAAYLNNQAPPYPSMSRTLKEEGLVILEVEVDPSGNASQVQIKQSSGFIRLDDAALKVVKGWQFVAARKNKKFVTSKVQIPINFVLE
ncbi:MAG: TonB family protein [Rickettsiales bacterium]